MNTIGKRSVLSKDDIGDRYFQDGAEYTRMWPFTREMRVFVKGFGGQRIEVHLDHDHQAYKILENNIAVIKAYSPFALHCKLYEAGYSALTVRNWSDMWVSIDGGNTYVVAKDLNHKYALRHGFTLTEKVRKDIPKE